MPTEISQPKNEADFERMCAQVYGVVFQDPNPKINGRKGQTQGGVDVFVNAKSIGRIGIQSKKYFRTLLEWKHIVDEVEKADKFKTPIKRLLIATTSPSDAALLKQVQLLSDDREAKGLFTVEVEFWDDIENRIRAHASLQDSFAPNLPGAAYFRQERQLSRIEAVVVENRDALAMVAAVPAAREDSANKFISEQLDRTNVFLKGGQYRDALAHIDSIGKDLNPFDAHQKARWYLQRGLSLWFSREDIKEAARHFLKAAEIYPDDERVAAGHIRGLLLNEEVDAAIEVGKSSLERFPNSQHVWLINVNARILKKEEVRIEELPRHLQEEPDVLQIFAIAARQRGDLAEAVRLSEKSASRVESGFFAKLTALKMAVEDAGRDPITSLYGLLPKAKLDALTHAIERFEPRREMLWAIQTSAAAEAAIDIGFAFLLKRDFAGAVAFAEEAASNGVYPKEILRVHIQALSELSQDEAAIAIGRKNIKDLNHESTITTAELAGNTGDIALIEEIIEQIKAWQPPSTETLDILTAIRWTAIARKGGKEVVVEEITRAQLIDSSNFILVCAAARILSSAGQALEETKLIDRAKALIDQDSSIPDRLMLAELLFSAKRWGEAATLYEALTPGGSLSKLHVRLLCCYVEADSRKKAKELLSQLPEGWIDDDEIRQLAMNLGQKANDWAFLVPLAEAQARKEPSRAISWAFQLHVARHTVLPAVLQDIVRRVPEELTGSIRSLAQLAALELRYGEDRKGLRRLYRMLRSNLDEPEAFSAYFISIVAAPPSLSLMEEELPIVVAGSSVVLVDDAGHELQVVIDPSDVGALPKRTDFLSPTSKEAQSLLGASVGQRLEIAARAFGGLEKYTVKSIQSAYRRLIQLAQVQAKSVGGIPGLKAVEIGTSGDGEKDLSRMHEEIKRGSEKTKQLLDAYAAGSLTLSGFAKMHGRSPVELVLGWPSEGPPIFVSNGSIQEQSEASSLLAQPGSCYVIDALSLAELVSFDVPDVLDAIPKLLISPVTKDILDDYLAEAEADQSVGTATEIDGKLTFVEFDDAHRQRRIAFAKKLVEISNKSCIVQPAYGDLAPLLGVPRFVDVLGREEHEMLLLATEQKAQLISLDGRLRLLAKLGASIDGVWPQALIAHCVQTKKINAQKASEFAIKQLLSNRRFISIRAEDLIWMLQQGGVYLQQGFQAIKRYLEHPETGFQSTSQVVMGFLSLATQIPMQFGVLGELLQHTLEPLLRHKDCTPEFEGHVSAMLQQWPEALAEPPHFYMALNMGRSQLIEMRRRYLRDIFEVVKIRAKNPIENHPIAICTLFCSKVPMLILDKKSNPTQPKESIATRIEED